MSVFEKRKLEEKENETRQQRKSRRRSGNGCHARTHLHECLPRLWRGEACVNKAWENLGQSLTLPLAQLAPPRANPRETSARRLRWCCRHLSSSSFFFFFFFSCSFCAPLSLSLSLSLERSVTFSFFFLFFFLSNSILSPDDLSTAN